MKSNIGTVLASIGNLFYQRFIVKSMTRQGIVYIVERCCGVWSCSCPDAMIRNRECKHVRQLKMGSYPSVVYSYRD